MFTSFVTLWIVSCQGPLSMGFPRNLKDPGIEPVSSALAGGFFTTELPWKPLYISHQWVNITLQIIKMHR